MTISALETRGADVRQLMASPRLCHRSKAPSGLTLLTCLAGFRCVCAAQSGQFSSTRCVGKVCTEEQAARWPQRVHRALRPLSSRRPEAATTKF
jgi:hypothetical protein